MSDLLLKIGDGSGYEDGDILCAFTDHQIECRTIMNMASSSVADRDIHGYIKEDSLWFKWQMLTREIKIVRVSSTEVLRVDLWGGDQRVIGPIKNLHGERINVPLYIKRRRESGNFEIAKSDGNLVWFGGKTKHDSSTMSDMWEFVEQKNGFRRSDVAGWPYGRVELKSYLALPVESLTEEEAIEAMSPDLDIHGNILRKRRNTVPWRDLVETKDIDRILNRAIYVDLRETMNPVQKHNVRRKRRLQDVALDIHSQ